MQMAARGKRINEQNEVRIIHASITLEKD